MKVGQQADNYAHTTAGEVTDILIGDSIREQIETIIRESMDSVASDVLDIISHAYDEGKSEHEALENVIDFCISHTQGYFFEDWLATGEAVAVKDGTLADLADGFSSTATAVDPEREALLATPLTSCDLSVRTLNICKANGIETLGDLTKLYKTDWLKFRNSGKKSLIEIDELLEANGLSWKQWEE